MHPDDPRPPARPRRESRADTTRTVAGFLLLLAALLLASFVATLARAGVS